ncbi:MAG: hypothetical protein ACK5ME_11245 [Parahaliea sp.]
MYINRVLLILLGLALIFLPTIEHWLWNSGARWYRPYLLWLAAIALCWWIQHSKYRDEL